MPRRRSQARRAHPAVLPHLRRREKKKKVKSTKAQKAARKKTSAAQKAAQKKKEGDERKRKQEADKAERSMQLLATKQRKVEANQFKKHIVDGQKIIAVLTPCIQQVEAVKAKVGYDTVEETMKVPLEKRLHELKIVVSHIMVQSLDPHPEAPPNTYEKAPFLSAVRHVASLAMSSPFDSRHTISGRRHSTTAWP